MASMATAARLGLFEIANYAEAALWFAIALYCATRAIATRRSSLWLLTVALLLFGISDIVEVQTGAWYRPWWLLAWKAACVLAILSVGVPYIRARRKRRKGG